MEVEVYKKEGLGEIRVQKDEGGEAWFCAKDLCKSLGLSNYRDALKQHVDSEDVVKRYTLTKGGRQKTLYVNESGMYTLIFLSKKENARQFRKWVTKEVLPMIRKTGSYEGGMTGEEARQLQSRQDELEGRLSAMESERRHLITDFRRLLREEQIRLTLEKHHELLGNENILVRDMARILRELGHDVSDTGLYSWMREWGYLEYEGDDYNLPLDIDIEAGLFKVGMRRYRGVTYRVALLTPKGQRWLIRMLERM